MKEVIRLSIFLVVALAFLPIASAEILISQPEEIYNVGDELSVNVILKPASNTNDFLEVLLNCGEESVVIYKNSFSLDAGSSSDVGVQAILGRSLIYDLSGKSCSLTADYGVDNVVSQTFELSGDIDVDIDIDKKKFEPGEEVRIFGTAEKNNGNLIEGFISITIPSLGVVASGTVNSGKFDLNFTLPESASPGEHKLRVRIYEEDNVGQVSNEFISNNTIIKISQVLNDLNIKLNKQNVIPGEEITYSVNAVDQIGDLLDVEASLKIFEPGDFVYFESVIKSGEELKLRLKADDVPGYWKIEAIVSGEIIRKLFYVEEIELIQTSLINDTLIVNNVGNVLYSGPLEISIGSANEIRYIELDVGEIKKFRLKAPDGNYLIRINDGNEDVQLGTVALTGRVISVREFREGILDSIKGPWAWLIAVILVLLIIIYVLVKRAKAGKLKLRMPKFRKQEGVSKEKNIPASAKTGEVMYGRKENAAIIALKTYGELDTYSSKAVSNALVVAKQSGSKVYVDGDYKIILFSHTLTREKDNELLATKVAKRIETSLKEHNKKSSRKVKFGIGVSEGTIISERKNGVFKFTTIKNIIGRAKGIAKVSEGDALLSDGMHGKVAGKVNTLKIQDHEAWRITKIKDHSKHRGFIERFTHKHKAEKEIEKHPAKHKEHKHVEKKDKK